jgi:hypothetical protein
MLIGEVAAEGFVDAVTPDLATASTTLIPRITDQTVPPGRKPRGPRKRSGRVWWLPMVALGMLAVLVVVGIAVAMSTTGGGRITPAANGKPAATPSVSAGGVSFSPEGATEATDCAGHAYGDVKVWLGQHPCVHLVRSVYQTTADGHPAAVALAVVTFSDQATATAFGTVANTTGTGGITNLVAEGSRWAGGPTSFDNAAYTVLVQDTSVRLTEVVWIGRTSSPTDPALAGLATASAGLPGSS